MKRGKKGKFKKTIVSQVKEENQEKKNQEKLKNRYHVEEKDVLVVEKSNMIKFFVRTVGGIVKLLAGITFFLLAVVGLAALIYPESRNVLHGQAQQIWHELLILLPF